MKLVIYSFLIFLSGISEAKSLKWKDVSFFVDAPSAWREAKDLYGIPVTLLGPSLPGKPRAVIQIIPTDISEIKISENDAKEFGEKYSEGRVEWLKKQEGTLLKSFPGEYSSGRLTAAVTYKINSKRFFERTTYVKCPKKLFHIKIVLNFENLDSLKEIEDIVRSFKCDG